MENKIIIMSETDFKRLLRNTLTELLEDALEKTEKKRGTGAMLNKRQAADLLACSVSTIEVYSRNGKLTRHYVGKKAVRYDKMEVLRLAERKPYYRNPISHA